MCSRKSSLQQTPQHQLATSVQKRVRKQVSIFTTQSLNLLAQAFFNSCTNLLCRAHAVCSQLVTSLDGCHYRSSANLHLLHIYRPLMCNLHIATHHTSYSLRVSFSKTPSARKDTYLLHPAPFLPTTSQTVAGQAAVGGIYWLYSSDISICFSNSYCITGGKCSVCLPRKLAILHC